MTTGSHIGKTFWIASGVPATNDAAGFAALTWTQVKGVQTLPELGVTHADIPVPDLQTGFTSGIKGAGTGNDSTATFRKIAADAGQTSIRNLANAGGTAGACSIRIVKGSGAAQALVTGDPVQYAQGYVHSYVEIQGDDSSHEGFSVNFRQNALTVDATF